MLPDAVRRSARWPHQPGATLSAAEDARERGAVGDCAPVGGQPAGPRLRGLVWCWLPGSRQSVLVLCRNTGQELHTWRCGHYKKRDIRRREGERNKNTETWQSLPHCVMIVAARSAGSQGAHPSERLLMLYRNRDYASGYCERHHMLRALNQGAPNAAHFAGCQGSLSARTPGRDRAHLQKQPGLRWRSHAAPPRPLSAPAAAL